MSVQPLLNCRDGKSRPFFLRNMLAISLWFVKSTLNPCYWAYCLAGVKYEKGRPRFCEKGLALWDSAGIFSGHEYCLFICHYFVDGIEGHYSRDIGIKFRNFNHIVVSGSMIRVRWLCVPECVSQSQCSSTCVYMSQGCNVDWLVMPSMKANYEQYTYTLYSHNLSLHRLA